MNEIKTYQQLRYGNFHLLYKNGTIRHITQGSEEVLRRIYPAVRDQNWATVPYKVTSEDVIVAEKDFLVKATLLFTSANIRFKAEVKIAGNEDGKLSFEFTGKANSSFLKNRIGLNVLFPIKGFSGNMFETVSPKGNRNKHVFPEWVSPHQPAKDIQQIYWTFIGEDVNLYFEGDVFEMEDQRNWTDAFYKVYSTPLELPFPVEMRSGDQIKQKVILEGQNNRSTENSAHQKALKLQLVEPLAKYPSPDVGIRKSTGNVTFSEKEVSMLQELNAGHYRVELHFSGHWQERLKQAKEEGEKLHLSLYLVLYFTDKAEQELKAFEQVVASTKPFDVKFVLILDENSGATVRSHAALQPRLKEVFPDAKIGCGVRGYFVELNRTRPDADGYDFVAYSICPQVHAVDNLTLIENLEGQKYTVRSAQHIYQEKPIHVSPVTLNQRFKKVASNKASNASYPLTDARQHSLFNAMWTMISLKYLAESGTHATTYFEAAGDQSMLHHASGSAKHSTVKDLASPVYQVLKFVLSYDGIISIRSGNPLVFDGLLLRKNRSNCLILANFSSNPQQIHLDSFIIDTITKNAIIREITEESLEREIAAIPYKKLNISGPPVINIAPNAITMIESYESREKTIEG